MTNILFKIVRICHSQFQCNFPKNEKLFLNVLLNCWNVHQILNILKENMIAIANVFPKIEIVKNLVRPLFKTRRLRTRFESHYVKASKILNKSPWEHFSHVFSSSSGELIRNMYPLVLGEIVGVFVNILTADDNYPVQDCQNLLLSI